LQIPQLWRACLPANYESLANNRVNAIAQAEALKEEKKRIAKEKRDAKKAEKARIAAEKKAEQTEKTGHKRKRKVCTRLSCNL
jgi:hypothetical protein